MDSFKKMFAKFLSNEDLVEPLQILTKIKSYKSIELNACHRTSWIMNFVSLFQRFR